MPKEYFEHITATGERWDLVAYRYYGDAKMIRPLLLANPDLTGNPETPAPLVFKAGIRLRVPVLADEEILQPQLPPWKRT